MQINSPELLKLYAVDATNKEYEFWQRDSLPFELLNKETLKQKLDYIHNNPNAEHWKLCKEPADYSSAKLVLYASLHLPGLSNLYFCCMNKLYFYLLSFLFFFDYNKANGQTEITKWQDGKAGAVSITYDDGSINQFRYALPVMKRLNLPATFYIITGPIPGSKYQGKFIGRPVHDIITETATVPTNADNYFERASAAKYGPAALFERRLVLA